MHGTECHPCPEVLLTRNAILARGTQHGPRPPPTDSKYNYYFPILFARLPMTRKKRHGKCHRPGPHNRHAMKYTNALAHKKHLLYLCSAHIYAYASAEHSNKFDALLLTFCYICNVSCLCSHAGHRRKQTYKLKRLLYALS